MRVRWNESTMQSKRLRRDAPWLCLAACLCVLGLAALLEEHKIFAQASPVPSTSTGQIGISPEEPVAPPQPIIVKVPAPGEANSNPAGTSPRQSPKAGADAGQDAGSSGSQRVRLAGSPDADSGGEQEAQAPKAAMPAVPDPDPNNPVAVQSASLLKMAYDLKSEVDKTTKDTLSVTVVRRAAEIEQLARKMRAK
jgi:type VI protein secretion system component VasF